jgi:hypothetical protein
MMSSAKMKMIAKLDAEFDEAIFGMLEKQQLMDRSRSFGEKAKHAAEAAELESYANLLFAIAQFVLEV